MAWPSGQLAKSYTESREVIREYFRILFDGETISYQEPPKRDRQANLQQAKEDGLPDLDPTVISTWDELDTISAHKKTF